MLSANTHARANCCGIQHVKTHARTQERDAWCVSVCARAFVAAAGSRVHNTRSHVTREMHEKTDLRSDHQVCRELSLRHRCKNNVTRAPMAKHALQWDGN